MNAFGRVAGLDQEQIASRAGLHPAGQRIVNSQATCEMAEAECRSGSGGLTPAPFPREVERRYWGGF